MCLHIKIMITLKITLVLKELDSVLKYHILESIEPRSMHGSRALIGGGGGGVHVYIFKFCPINSFEINLISKELVGQNLDI